MTGPKSSKASIPISAENSPQERFKWGGVGCRLYELMERATGQIWLSEQYSERGFEC